MTQPTSRSSALTHNCAVHLKKNQRETKAKMAARKAASQRSKIPSSSSSSSSGKISLKRILL